MEPRTYDFLLKARDAIICTIGAFSLAVIVVLAFISLLDAWHIPL